jgi:hypothetical protein
LATLRHRWHRLAEPCGEVVPSRADACSLHGGWRGPGGRLRGRDGEHFGVGLAVVLGQDLAEIARPVPATVRWQIWQRVTGRWVTVIGKRWARELGVLITSARGVLGASAAYNNYQRSRAEAEAAAQWRLVDHETVHITSQRICLQGRLQAGLPNAATQPLLYLTAAVEKT